VQSFSRKAGFFLSCMKILSLKLVSFARPLNTEHFLELRHENLIGREENRILMLFLQKLRQRTPITDLKHYNPNIYRY
jgi:hypothetical protein